MALLGRILLGIALALLALVLLLLFLPIRLRVSWDRGDACVAVRFGPARLPLYPPGESGSPEEEKTRKREKKQKKKKETEPKAAGRRERNASPSTGISSSIRWRRCRPSWAAP